MHQNKRKRRNGSKNGKRRKGETLTAMYEEIVSDLCDMGWKSTVVKIRSFHCIHVEDVRLSAFITGSVLLLVSGKLPPVVKTINIGKPGVDLVETINKECSRILTNPKAII